MVRESTHVPPVVPVAVSAACAFYAFTALSSFLTLERRLAAVIDFGVAVTAAGIAASLYISLRSRPETGCRTIRFIYAGILLAFTAWSVHATTDGRYASLLPRDQWRTVYCTAWGEPRNWGEKFRILTCDVREVTDAADAVFSASGTMEAVLPAELVRSGLPGGIADGRGTRSYIADGFPLVLSGETRKDRNGRSAFYADAIVARQTVPTDSDQGVGIPMRLRSALRLRLIRLLYEWGASGGFLLALLSGSREYLEPDTAEAFRSTGLSHILALSGMHLSLLGGVALGAGTKIGGRKLGIRLALPAMLFFVWFAGSSPSLLRALLMSLLSHGCLLLGIPVKAGALLAGAVILHMMIAPADMVSIAFMLSTGALLGIIVIGESLTAIVKPSIPVSLASPIAASIGAQCMTAPLVSLVFGCLAPCGILASVFVSPFASFFLVSGLAVVTISLLVPAFAHASGALIEIQYACILRIIDFFRAFPPLSLSSTAGKMTAGFMPLLIGLCFVYLSFRSSKRRSSLEYFTGL
ncbi:MAG: ComEC/Rec2 family competence protein [Spirochaetales bacterium]|nr:ComEC/Rec2 family competence protein [Spirochaetales bacterium]